MRRQTIRSALPPRKRDGPVASAARSPWFLRRRTFRPEVERFEDSTDRATICRSAPDASAARVMIAGPRRESDPTGG